MGSTAPADAAAAVFLLPVVAHLLALFAAASAEDGDHWKCYSTCMHKCDQSTTTTPSAPRPTPPPPPPPPPSGTMTTVHKCIEECFDDVPAVCYHMCVADRALHLPGPCPRSTDNPSRSHGHRFPPGATGMSSSPVAGRREEHLIRLIAAN
ncbi:hypothetical protein GUJ93_ZPchr0001g31124 [Zizania palustris]|uniref:Uncharacterized protein n=1 Tax=Zizania palustris TaxID=103762 RepID=A0A8J5RPJ7_ZIZPA|nr:hypothetical protein GUJ93_ZPchr0001g31124 [Zizania palustris]